VCRNECIIVPKFETFNLNIVDFIKNKLNDKEERRKKKLEKSLYNP